MPRILRAIVDSDHGADRLMRRSTTEMVQRLGLHTIKTTSNFQKQFGVDLEDLNWRGMLAFVAVKGKPDKAISVLGDKDSAAVKLDVTGKSSKLLLIMMTRGNPWPHSDFWRRVCRV